MGQRHVMYFSARTEGRISYGHLGRTNLLLSLPANHLHDLYISKGAFSELH